MPQLMRSPVDSQTKESEVDDQSSKPFSEQLTPKDETSTDKNEDLNKDRGDSDDHVGLTEKDSRTSDSETSSDSDS